jgi:uncharacterized cupredoxin-like copper-binding protein
MSSQERSIGALRVRLDRRQMLRFAAISGAGAALAGSFGSRLLAQSDPSTPAVAGSLPANVSVVVEGLQNPRYVAIAGDGTIYLSEAGSAGDDAPFATPVGGTPPSAEPVTTRGETGFVSAIAPDGTKTVIAEGFPSYLFGAEIVGPAGIEVVDGQVLFVNGGAGPATPMVTQLPNENSVISIDLATGAATNIANIGAYEVANNPDPNAVDSNCYDLVVANGIAYVSDAGGNTIYIVDLATNELKVLAVIPGLPGPGANPARQGKEEIDPVPTGLAMQDDGTLLVGLLSGAPFAPGTAGIVKVAPDGTVTNWAGGLTLVVAVAIAPDGTVYATQLSANFLADPMLPGSIVRLGTDGSSEIVLDGLSAPNGLAFDANGDLYVVVNTFGTENGGALLKIADPASLTNVVTGTPEPADLATPEPVAAAGVTVESLDLRFEPKEFDVPAGVDFTITVKNVGVLPHDFSMDSPKLTTGTIQSGGEAQLTVNLKPGDYAFYCSIPGHRQAGMRGTIHVS